MDAEEQLVPGNVYAVSMELTSGKTYEVLVKPNSKQEEITIQAGKIIVRVQELAQAGKANKAVVKLFKEKHAISIEIVSGYTSKKKRVLVKKSGTLSTKGSPIQQLNLFT